MTATARRTTEDPAAIGVTAVVAPTIANRASAVGTGRLALMPGKAVSVVESAGRVRRAMAGGPRTGSRGSVVATGRAPTGTGPAGGPRIDSRGSVVATAGRVRPAMAPGPRIDSPASVVTGGRVLTAPRVASIGTDVRPMLTATVGGTLTATVDRARPIVTVDRARPIVTVLGGARTATVDHASPIVTVGRGRPIVTVLGGARTASVLVDAQPTARVPRAGRASEVAKAPEVVTAAGAGSGIDRAGPIATARPGPIVVVPAALTTVVPLVSTVIVQPGPTGVAPAGPIGSVRSGPLADVSRRSARRVSPRGHRCLKTWTREAWTARCATNCARWREAWPSRCRYASSPPVN